MEHRVIIFWCCCVLLNLCHVLHCTPSFKVTPRLIRRTREKRESYMSFQIELQMLDTGPILLNLNRNEGLMLESGVVEYVYANGTRTIEPILARESLECLYVGSVDKEISSLVAVSVCDGISGYIQREEDGYIIKPCTENPTLESEHSMEIIPPYIRNPQEKKYNMNKPDLREDKIHEEFGTLDEEYMGMTEGDRTSALSLSGEQNSTLGLSGEQNNTLSLSGEQNSTLGLPGERNSTLGLSGDQESTQDASGEQESVLNVAGEQNVIQSILREQNSTQSTKDQDSTLTAEQVLNRSRRSQKDEIIPNSGLSGDEDVFHWYDVNLDDAMAETDSNSDLDWMGHVLGDVWQVDTAAARRKVQRQKGHIVCNGPYCEYFRVKKDDPKWLETALYIDHSVIQFHGKDTVKQYILTLINIVSAIYGDPTLGANLKFVITRMIFYDDESINPIVEDDSKASLENVNSWNTAVWRGLDKVERHDISVWLTRKNIGGPSGYAPVSGVCDPERSCSLNRDEGLSSAFILAHELGHILGLSHDGDLGAGNTCSKESNEGSIMASMVAATFSYFHWSSCSAGEYHFKSNQWSCMRNKPKSSFNYTFISEKIEYEYSLDDQCRMEFDQGYSFCRSFQLSDPCAHLWCTHNNNPELCKTKKGPPMDGTACGKNKWCINGYCESTSKSLESKDGLKHNALSGGWSSWSRWGDCTRTCGGGVSFRTRRCDNPRPSYGGKPCPGISEEYQLCNIYRCIKYEDFRADQCNTTFQLITGDSTHKPQEWLPYEHEDLKYKCRLACYNTKTKEHVMTDDHVIDGTPCSYDHPSNICIQGACVEVGCDKILGSPLEEDQCGICAGDGTKCITERETIQRKVNKMFTKVFLLPAGSRWLEVQKISGDKVHLVMKERKSSSLFLDGTTINSGYKSLISHGAKFEFRSVHGREFVTARGPLLAPILVGLTGVEGEEGEVYIKYTYEPKEDTLSSRSRYEWQTRGWSTCSEDCGGGVQKMIIRCYDSITGNRVQRKHCGVKRNRPRTEHRPCNTFQCEAEWVEGDWENCDQTCGKTGTQFREVFCLPSHENRTDQIWRNMVDVRFCVQPKPEQIRECNRVPCPVYWVEQGWGPCSVSCGAGYMSMLYMCTGPGQNVCGARSIHRTVCNPGDCTTPCRKDQSPVCKRKEMRKYCDITAYRDRCCETCS